MLPANELESIALPDGTTQVLGPADHDVFPIFENLCLFTLGYPKSDPIRVKNFS